MEETAAPEVPASNAPSTNSPPANSPPANSPPANSPPANSPPANSPPANSPPANSSATAGGARRTRKGPPAVGTKAQVYHGTAKHTSGGLTRKDLMKTKKGRIVSRKKHAAGKKALKRLVKAGYKAKKGKFSLFKK